MIEKIKKSSFARNALNLFSSNTFGLVVRFIASIIIARMLGPDGKGFLTALLVYPNMVVKLSQMGIRQAAVYELGKSRDDVEKIIGNIISLFLITTSVGILICLLVLIKVFDEQLTIIILCLLLITIPFNLVKDYSSGIFLGLDKVSKSVSITWINNTTYIFSILVLVLWLEGGVTEVLIAQILSLIPPIFYAGHKLLKISKLKISFDLLIQKRMLSLGSIYALAIFLNSLNYKIDIILLQFFSTNSEIGLYSVGVKIGELILQVPSAVGLIIFSKSANSKNPQAFSKKNIRLLSFVIPLAVIFGAIIFFSSEFVIPFVYGEEFSGSITMVQYIIPGIICLTIYKIIGFDLAGKGKPWVSVMASFPAVIINVVLNLILIPKYGGNGAAISSSISYAVMAIIHWIIYKSILKNYKTNI